MVELNDEELLLRLKNFEDNFVERKTSGDSGDWLKTVVGFANSTPIGYSAVLFIGANNDGTPQEKTVDLDSLQKTISKKVSEAYPPVYYLTKIVNVEAKQVLAVIVPGSPERPHFAGPAYIREGSMLVGANTPRQDLRDGRVGNHWEAKVDGPRRRSVFLVREQLVRWGFRIDAHRQPKAKTRSLL